MPKPSHYPLLTTILENLFLPIFRTRFSKYFSSRAYDSFCKSNPAFNPHPRKNEVFVVHMIYKSMKYDSKKPDEKRIIEQHHLTKGASTVKSSVLFLDRYYELLKPSGEMLIVLDDTVINGKSFENIRKWILEKFVILGVHSLPFNAFFKANANIKTSILHLRKKATSNENQAHIFMSVSNNIGHDNALKDTPFRNNLTEILISYLEWQRTGVISEKIRENPVMTENLEGPLQYWLVPPEKLTTERFDAFFYCPDLHNTYANIQCAAKKKQIKLLNASSLKLRPKLTLKEKKAMGRDECLYKYIEISDVTKYGLITNYIEDVFINLPTRGEYQVHTGDVLLALNNSSRGTVVLVPKEFNNAICTSGFLVIVPQSEDEGLLLWYALRSEICRKQIYYLAQTASQPELKLDTWERYFQIALPVGKEKNEALKKASEFYGYLEKLTNIDEYRFNL